MTPAMGKMDVFRLVLDAGDRVTGSGQMVAEAYGVWLDLARFVRLPLFAEQEHARPGSRRSVRLVGADAVLAAASPDIDPRGRSLSAVSASGKPSRFAQCHKQRHRPGPARSGRHRLVQRRRRLVNPSRRHRDPVPPTLQTIDRRRAGRQVAGRRPPCRCSTAIRWSKEPAPAPRWASRRP